MIKKIFSEYKRHGFFGIMRYVFDKITSLIKYDMGVLIRNPNYIRNEGKLKFGRGFSCGPGLIIDVYKQGTLNIGTNVKFNHRVHLGVMKEITIGDNCLFASNIVIIDHNHGKYTGVDQSSPEELAVMRVCESDEISIGSNVWIGENVCVLPGAKIGNNTIIGAGSIVKSKIPANSIVVGSPAKVIKTYDADQKKWIRTNE